MLQELQERERQEEAQVSEREAETCERAEWCSPVSAVSEMVQKQRRSSCPHVQTRRLSAIVQNCALDLLPLWGLRDRVMVAIQQDRTGVGCKLTACPSGTLGAHDTNWEN